MFSFSCGPQQVFWTRYASQSSCSSPSPNASWCCCSSAHRSSRPLHFQISHFCSPLQRDTPPKIPNANDSLYYRRKCWYRGRIWFWSRCKSCWVCWVEVPFWWFAVILGVYRDRWIFLRGRRWLVGLGSLIPSWCIVSTPGIRECSVEGRMIWRSFCRLCFAFANIVYIILAL